MLAYIVMEKSPLAVLDCSRAQQGPAEWEERAKGAGRKTCVKRHQAINQQLSLFGKKLPAKNKGQDSRNCSTSGSDISFIGG